MRDSAILSGHAVRRLVGRTAAPQLGRVFSSCLFCHASLGANERIEHFPVGRRLAFDGERGRLWAVCPKCARWNLTPIEERWEALEECEREYRATTQRVSTDNIALARLKDGTDLVRIGQPLRPEFNAWRYGEQLQRRRRRYFVGSTAAIAVGGAVLVGVPLLLRAYWLPALSMGVASHGLSSLGQWYVENRRRVGMLRLPDGSVEPFMRVHLLRSAVYATPDGEWEVAVHYRERGRIGPFTSIDRTLNATGTDARRVARDLLPFINGAGGSRYDVHLATQAIEELGNEAELLRRLAARRRGDTSTPGVQNHSLVMEMLLHEEDERRAMAGELGALYARWEDAERIAKIADGELSPVSRSGA